jgi:hypothetical protein
MEDADAIGRRRRLLLHETDRIEQAPLFLLSVSCRWRSAEGSRGSAWGTGSRPLVDGVVASVKVWSSTSIPHLLVSSKESSSSPVFSCSNPKKRKSDSSHLPLSHSIDLCSNLVRELALEIDLRAPRGSPPSPLPLHCWKSLVRGIWETLVFMLCGTR